ncbi:transmembrane protein [Blastocystis sp. ATCC 50177/Nand II]|uniref:GDT1 family protein n=1 Tax=Blastocystis sp. subtype 1 (strain ATCC 50177 / NandII) TaxID=478820 RepID=A0A196SME2_BLAHN|nr:transmembrane protein [Blastocystis sp. ATCC 50177/Nand II]
MNRSFLLCCFILLALACSAEVATADKQNNVVAIPAAQEKAVAANTPEMESTKEMKNSPVVLNVKGKKAAPAQQSWLSGFLKTFAMILSMEIGDKTFFIGAILAMNNNKWMVLIGSVAALVVMCVISCLIGLSAPILMSREISVVVASVLFVFFGVKMIIEGVKNKENSVQDEYDEAEESIKQHERSRGTNESDAESGLLGKKKEVAEKSACDWGSIILRTFVMVFFAEWGDRSQFSTIILAGTHPVSSVVAGASCGYLIASLCGVLGGHFFAKVISPRVISISGGILFILFAIQILIMKD